VLLFIKNRKKKMMIKTHFKGKNPQKGGQNQLGRQWMEKGGQNALNARKTQRIWVIRELKKGYKSIAKHTEHIEHSGTRCGSATDTMS